MHAMRAASITIAITRAPSTFACCSQCARSWQAACTCFRGLECHRPAAGPSTPPPRLVRLVEDLGLGMRRCTCSWAPRGAANCPAYLVWRVGGESSRAGNAPAASSLTCFKLQSPGNVTFAPQPSHLQPGHIVGESGSRQPSAGLTAWPRPRDVLLERIP